MPDEHISVLEGLQGRPKGELIVILTATPAIATIDMIMVVSGVNLIAET